MNDLEKLKEEARLKVKTRYANAYDEGLDDVLEHYITSAFAAGVNAVKLEKRDTNETYGHIDYGNWRLDGYNQAVDDLEQVKKDLLKKGL